MSPKYPNLGSPRKKGRVLRPVLYGLAVLILLLAGGYFLLRFSPFPGLDSFLLRPYSTVVTDRKGRSLETLPLEGGVRREYVSLEDIPPAVLEAFIVSEDGRFFSHPGVDGFAVARSLRDAAREGRIVSGASTVTMQLAGMVNPGRRTLPGKVREVFDALRIETRLSKFEILELWLNSLPFGSRAEGIQSGSRAVFGKSAEELTVPEALLLAVVPRRPRDLNPSTNPDAAVRAALKTADRYRLPVGEEELARAARWSADPGLPSADLRRGGGRPEVRHFLAAASLTPPRSGTEGGGSGRGLSVEAGERLRTTLDLEIQRRVEGLVRYALERYESHRIAHAAAVVLDTGSGEVLAYLGSPDYSSGREGSRIDAVRVPRQPGSCLKPLLYAFALEEGWEPWYILPDSPLDFGGAEVYTPTDFDNLYRGPVRFRVALASSLNVPAVYLLDEVGTEGFAEFLVSAGFPGSPAEIEQSGLGLALGNREVSLLALTRAFAVFPRGGTLPELSYIPLELSSIPSEVYGEGPDGGRAAGENRALPFRGKRIISRYTAGVINSILSDDSARIPGFGSGGVFDTPFPAVFKTGTSNQFQDIWALGATPRYTVGVWMGNLTGETVIGRAGSSIPLRIVRETLRYLHGSEGGELPEPPGAARVAICADTGNLAGEGCRVVIPEYTRKPPPRCEADHTSAVLGVTPVGRGGKEGVSILRPVEGAVFYYDGSLPPEIQAVRIDAAGGAGQVRISVNGRAEALLPAGEYSWYLPLSRGVFTITAESGGHTDSVHIEVR
jgi:penicillin-binding protein 1C